MKLLVEDQIQDFDESKIVHSFSRRQFQSGCRQGDGGAEYNYVESHEVH